MEKVIQDCNGEIIKFSSLSIVRARHITGSSDRSPTCDNCGSWIEHWENFSDKERDKCCVVGCEKDAKKGAHVQLVGKGIEDWFIVPVCKSHNPPTDEEVDIKPNTVFVRARQDLTCGK